MDTNEQNGTRIFGIKEFSEFYCLRLWAIIHLFELVNEPSINTPGLVAFHIYIYLFINASYFCDRLYYSCPTIDGR
jgi:hypothetical protein